jgi:hypothetical protein
MVKRHGDRMTSRFKQLCSTVVHAASRTTLSGWAVGLRWSDVTLKPRPTMFGMSPRSTGVP